MGSMNVLATLESGVLHLEFSNPPVNALSVRSGFVAALHAAIDRAMEDEAVRVVIISGASELFSAGADIADFDDAPERLADLRALFETIERAQKPVVAAISGLCLGGGLELALAAHFRVADASARFGFPEISLGLLPGGGGTQRAPRLVGAGNALSLMLGGKPINAEAAQQMHLVDHVVPSRAAAAARALAEKGAFLVPRRSSHQPVPDDLSAAIARARSGKRRSLAAENIIRCVEAIGDHDIAQGLSLEAQLFDELMSSGASRALRYGFFGRRLVTRIPGAAVSGAPPIEKVTIVGGGLMGTGIAIALLNAGLRVMVVEPRDEARSTGEASIKGSILRDAEKGRIAPDVAESRIAALTMARSIQDAADADLFIEAVFEDMAAKRDVFSQLSVVAPDHAILASNTSTLDLDVIASFTTCPERVVGLHFFSPANIMRLLEVVRGKMTSPETLARAMAFAKTIRKTGVVAGVCDGFIGNRIFEEYLRQAWFLLEEGALPQQIDKAIEDFGMAMGPCRVMDLAGQDIGWSIRKRRAVQEPDRPYSRVPDLICELGRFGQKTGAGFYLYPDGRTPQVDPAVEELILNESARIGLERRPINNTEIVERCIYAMANEGARILEDGIAYRPVDIDIVYQDGYGFPAERGGPMFYADEIGLPRVLDAIRRYAAGRHGWAWQPSKLLVDLAERNATFQESIR